MAVATYLRNPDDIVWAVVRGPSDRAFPERMVFGAGAFTLLGSAVLETWASAHDTRLPKRLARILLALGAGQLLPLPGLIVLLAGETILMLRLYLRDRSDMPATAVPSRGGRLFGLLRPSGDLRSTWAYLHRRCRIGRRKSALRLRCSHGWS